MLRRLIMELRNLSAGRQAGGDTDAANLELQSRAPFDAHLEVLFGAVRFGEQSYPDLLRRCAAATGIEIRAGDPLLRTQQGLNLARYFMASLAVPGQRAQCGAHRGLKALLMCHAARSIKPDFDGTGLCLFDSFEDPRGEPDRSSATGGTPALRPRAAAPAQLDTRLAHVQQALAAFPALDIRTGRTPEVLQRLAPVEWSFVHLDLDLHSPTLDGLEYFYPRLSRGGILISDHYGAARYPEARNAWDEFCGERDLAFIVLGTGQAVIIRD